MSPKACFLIVTAEEASPKCIGIVKAKDGESLADLQVHLEQKKVLKFNFQYWDRDECCRVAVPLESLNNIDRIVYIILTLDEEVLNLPSKW